MFGNQLIMNLLTNNIGSHTQIEVLIYEHLRIVNTLLVKLREAKTADFTYKKPF